MAVIGSESPASSLLTKEAACAHLGVSLSTLNRLVSEGTIKPTRLRGRVKFKTEDLDIYTTKVTQTT